MSNLTGAITLNETTLTGIDTLDLTTLNCEVANTGELIGETITTNDILINQYVFLDGSIKANNTLISPTEISYLKNCSGNIQSQINSIVSPNLVLAHVGYDSNTNSVVINTNLQVDGNINNTGLSNKFSVIDTKLTDVTYINNRTKIGNSPSNTLLINSNLADRGDSNAIYATANISTTGDIYMNCYSVGGQNYGFYKAIDFINQRDQICYDKGVEALNKANDAKAAADGAATLAGAASAATVTNAAATALVATNLATLDGIVAGHTTTLAEINTALAEIDTNVSELNGKTSLMNPATTSSSNFIKSVKIHTTENQINPVITLDPYSPSLFSNGMQVGQVLQANELSCDKIGCNQFNYSGDLNLPNTNTTFKTINTNNSSTQTLDGSTISIGHIGSTIYIGGAPYVPFNPFNFVNQWTGPSS